MSLGQRQRRRTRTVVPLLVAATIVVGVVFLAMWGPGGASSDGSVTEVDGETLISSLRVTMTPALEKFYDQTLEWRTCHRHFTCTSISEPTDWGSPGAGAISVALIKHAATGVSHGSLVVDPGGPGASGVDLVKYGVTNAVDATVAKNYDVIGLDPRGVGASTPVNCLDNAGEDEYLYGPVAGKVGSAQWIAGEKANARTLAAACRTNTGTLLEHIDTISAAHDLDVIRAALGETKLNYLGYSYGSYLGTVYAGLYPSKVGRFVFDGIDDPWSGQDDSEETDGGGSGYDFAADSTVAQARSFEKSLDSYLAACVTGKAVAVGTSSCPLPHSLASAKRAVTGLFSTMDAAPLRNADGRVLTSATLAIATIEPLYDQSDWPELTTMFRQVRKGTATRAFELADEYNDRSANGTYDDNLSTVSLAIGCLEDGSSVDLKYDRAELAKLRSVAPILGNSFAYGDLICSGWTGKEAPFPAPIRARGAAPILLVGTTGDPATPYQDAKSLAAQLVSAHLVTYNGEGHTAYDLGDHCVDATVDDYLIGGIVPSTDPECR